MMDNGSDFGSELRKLRIGLDLGSLFESGNYKIGVRLGLGLQKRNNNEQLKI